MSFVYFSPNGGAKEALINLFALAKDSINVAIYGFNDMDIANALISAQNRGVKVQVIMDKSETFGNQAIVHDTLVKTGMNVQVFHPPDGIMHNKFSIVDEIVLATGSFNYTTHATKNNCENLVVLTDGGDIEDAWIVALIQKYTDQFNYIQAWSEKENPNSLKTRIARFFRDGFILSIVDNEQ